MKSAPSASITTLPEVLAPAGNRACMEAAVRAGADAVYFGLPRFNARARADNFSEENLAETLGYLHEHGVRGYVTLNTLLFNEEIAALERAVVTCAEAGVDAVIVQDLGVLSIARAIAPSMHVHASTQMTCTDAAGCELAKELGARRVILARELSLDDIRAIAAGTDMELEVFVHGALCIAYSGQCLTSEAIGGRSANRGACAQACRLPYELVVDGVLRDLGDKAYLLSPQDLEAASAVADLAAIGVRSLKIEGRLKGPEYVAATTALYRAAVNALRVGDHAPPTEDERLDVLQQFTRGSDVGFFRGVNHQVLVEGRSSDHRGLLLGTFEGVVVERGKKMLEVSLARAIATGDGVLVEGGREGRGECGGRVWGLSVRGNPVDEARAGQVVRIWLGPDKQLPELSVRSRVFCTNSPRSQERVRARPDVKVPLTIEVSGEKGAPLSLTATSRRGHTATAMTQGALAEARSKGIDEALVRDKLGQFGDSPFEIAALSVKVPEGLYVSPSEIKAARRELVEKLLASSHRTHDVNDAPRAATTSLAPPPPPGLFVLCRTLEQGRAAIEAGADGVVLDFLELTGTGAALRTLRAESKTPIYVAPPRIRKPGEEKIDRFLLGLGADGLLIRSLGTLFDTTGPGAEVTNGVLLGDFSLNVTNAKTAREILRRGVRAFTPSFDLDAGQLLGLLGDHELASRAEVVLHHPMPLFHMEHCVYAALLSKGTDHRTCGRPCDTHALSLRDRANMDHPVIADVGCRNTVFHARAQSGATLAAELQRLGVSRFRIELVRENAEQTKELVTTYAALLAGRIPAEQAWQSLRAEAHYGVVRGSLRVLTS